MDNKGGDDDDEEINEKKIRNEDILSEEELINTLDMTAYRERIDNIIGRNYSFYYFEFFDNIYHLKIKNKISAPLTDFLKKANKKEDTFWMRIFKSIKLYSKDNLPVLIIKYFYSKAEVEFKFIFNESKKYTNNPYKFIDIYIKKMKKFNTKKLKELNENKLSTNIFSIQPKRSLFYRTFLSKKTLPYMKKSQLKNTFLINNDEDYSDSSTKEEEIKNKKQMRTQIMKQIHQLKMNTIKEVERANNIQNKQKKKYGKIKSRFLDVFTKQQKYTNILNSKSNNKLNYNIYRNFNFHKSKEEDDNFPSSQRIKNSINNSKLSYLYSKDFNYSKKNSKFLSDDKNISNNNYYFYTNTQSHSNRISKSSFRNSLGSGNKLKLPGFSAKNSNNSKNKVSLFNLDLKYKNNAINEYKLFSFSNSKKNDINKIKISEHKDIKKRPKSGFIRKKNDAKSLINKLEKKRNEEFLDNYLYRNNVKDDYNNKIYELFKRTECF